MLYQLSYLGQPAPKAASGLIESDAALVQRFADLRGGKRRDGQWLDPWAGTTLNRGMTDIVLDLRGLKCPLPVLRTRKALFSLPIGATLTVECTDPLAAIDIPHLLRETGHHLVSQTRGQGVVTFRIRNAGDRAGGS